MLSKCVVGGTRYSIVRGAVCIEGTIHLSRQTTNAGSIVVIEGTNYKTLLGKNSEPWEMGQHMTRYAIAGRDSSSPGKPSISLAEANNYAVFYIYNGYIGIYHMVSDGSSITSTQLASTSTGVTLTTNGTTVTPSNNRYGSTLYAATLDGDPDLFADFINNYNFVRVAGRNSSTKNTVSYSYSSADGDTNMYHAVGDWYIQCTNNYICMRAVTGVPPDASYSGGIPSYMPSGNTNQMSRAVNSGGTITRYLSLDESTNASVNGGSFISCRQK